MTKNKKSIKTPDGLTRQNHARSRSLIETVNDELKNIEIIDKSRLIA